MKLFFVTSFVLISSFLFAQKKVARYYVGGKLYATHTYYVNLERGESSSMNVSNTQNYKGTYTSCAGCRSDNTYGVSELQFTNSKNNKEMTLLIRYIDKQNCIMVFQTSDHDSNKTEIYAAKEMISDK